MTKTQPPLITTAQAAEMAGRSHRAIIRRVEAGKLTPAQKLPGIRGAFLFNPADVEALSADETANADRTT